MIRIDGAAPAAASEAAHAASPASAASKPKDAKLHAVAAEFEGMLVRQLLTAAHMGGHGKEDAYSGMAVDALANGVEGGGGLGLTRAIEDALARSATSSPKDSSK